jgi:hypothetical protein
MGLLTLSAGFWDFDECSKRDVLSETKHLPLILGALNDRETRIDSVDPGTFILYGEEQALLISPQNVVLRTTIIIYRTICMWREI